MGRYSFHVGLFHPLLHAGFNRRSLRVLVLWVPGDYRLRPDSPCINAGDPTVVAEPGMHDLDGHARVLCGRVDMGPYEFGIGDANCDREVNLIDFAAFQRCYTGPDGEAAGEACAALDFDGDGDVDLDDHTGYRTLLFAPQADGTP